MHIVGAGQGALVALCLGISRYLAVKLVHTLHPLPFSTSQLKSPRIPSRQSVKPLLALALAWLMLSLMTAQQAYAADDYSDAPTTYGNPTHLIAGTLKLGANAPDSETTLTPLDGTGDDVNGIDDEDGVSGFPALMVGATSYFLPATHISATGTGTLHAWIDFNQDGVFSATEYKAVAVTAGTLARSLSWNGITVSSAGTTYARFRFTSSVLTDNAGTSSLDERATVAASDGEVEDYPLTIEPLVIPTNYCRSETLIASGNFTTNPVPVSTGWSYATAPFDTPIIGGAYNYPTDGNAYHNSNLTGGLYDDFNPAGNPATGIYSALQESDGTAAAVTYKFPHISLPGTYYYSFDLSSRFNQTIFADQYKISLYNADTDQIVTVLQQDFVDTLPTAVSETPAWKNFSSSFQITTSARYYLLFQIDQNLGSQNSDYMIDRAVVVAQDCPESDYSDAPASYGAPSHFVLGNLKLGANLPDGETTLTPLDGTGDDVNGIDDEDGVTSFPALLTGATSYSIPAANLSATGTGTLHAWIDFNKDGAFALSEHRSVTVTNGVLSGPLSWTGIVAGSVGTTYARFRFTSGTLTDNAGTTTVDERATSADAP
ncbi:GEVED domain-containing protein, partial [Thiothrix eikelboomii]|uniref:GEVED domain-containing protein n=1 Tax=Thiothrix eikelboomii TaxID=92487 RepID=UPI003BB0E648